MGCQVGDIIVVRTFESHGHAVGRHSFVVLSTDRGQIQGLDYDLVCNVMSSFHSPEHRQKKRAIPETLNTPLSRKMLEAAMVNPGT